MNTVYMLRFKNLTDVPKNANRYVGVECSGNDDSDGFCGSYSANLCAYADNKWSTTSKEKAEEVCNNNINWYNSDIEQPQNPYVGKLEVVEIILP